MGLEVKRAVKRVVVAGCSILEHVTNKFVNYTYKINRELVGKTIDQPDKVLDHIAKYPETTVCTEVESSSQPLFTAHP